MRLPVFHTKVTKFQNSFTFELERNNVIKSEKHDSLVVPKIRNSKPVSTFVDLTFFSKYLVFLIFLIYGQLSFCQQPLNKQIPPYLFKNDIQKAKDPIDRIDDFIVSGLYKDSYKISDSMRDVFTIDPWLTPEDSTAIIQGEVKPAIPFFAELGKGIDVFLISEMHDDPKTRAFTTALLPKFKNAGFTHFSAEAILDSFSFTKSRPYPIIKDTILTSSSNNFRYLHEPVYAEMIRTAASLNFNIFSYEAQSNFVTKYEKNDGSYRRETPDGKYFVEVIMKNNTISKSTNYNRDSIQAAQIASVFKTNPNAKVIINVGQGHSQKLDGTMRNYLDTMLPKKNILSVFQYVMGARYLDTLGDNPVAKLRNVKVPSVIIGKQSKEYYLKGDDNTDHVDYHVIHPPTKWINDRPSWLTVYLGRKGLRVTKTLNRLDACPCKAAVYNYNELSYGFNKAIPLDIIEVTKRDDFPNAYLSTGEGFFTVIAWNKFGKTVVDYYKVND